MFTRNGDVAALFAAIGGIVGLTTGIAAQSIPLSAVAQSSGAQVTTQYGIEFVTIGAMGNAPWQGTGEAGDMALGRGSVDYLYRIGRYEVTTQQWAQFINAWRYVSVTQGAIPFVRTPFDWSAVPGTNPYGGGFGWVTPENVAMRPVGGIDWRTAAIYCNWLHNNQSLTRDAFMNGAYDVSTFGVTGNTITDQQAHNPDARFWIPTWDEWLKAAHYDPNRFGSGSGGYWYSSNASNVLPTYGPPGQAEANANWGDGGAQYRVNLGAYPTTQSPWGLLDVAGATCEWTESTWINPDGIAARIVDGSGMAQGPFSVDYVSTRLTGYTSVQAPFNFGLRIAAAVPSPASAAALLGGLVLSARRRR